MNRSVVDVGGAAVVVSQFTLAAEAKGDRPGFSTAAPLEAGRRLYEQLMADLAAQGAPVGGGVRRRHAGVAGERWSGAIRLDTAAF